MARLQQHYREKVAPDLMKQFGYKSPMEVPRITKITLNMGVSEAVADKKVMDNAVADLTKIAGRDKGKRGTVSLRVDEDRVVVDGINIVKKHAKPNPMKGVQGGIIEKAMPIQQSNVAIYNKASGKADRVGIKTLQDGTRVRVFKSSGEEIKA